MRLLVVSNFYPPHYIGGYELGCQEVVGRLKARGHEVKVLTSTYGVERPTHDHEVYRWLTAEDPMSRVWDGWLNYSYKYRFQQLVKELTNQRAFRRLCQTFKPDLIYAWNLRFVSISIAFIAQQLNIPVAYFVSDEWLAEWKRDPGYYWSFAYRPEESWREINWKKPQHLLFRPTWELVRSFTNATGLLTYEASLRLDHLQLASDYLKQALRCSENAEADSKVIHWGIDIRQFPYKQVCQPPRRLLYVGRVVPEKGVHTVIEALGLLAQQPGYESLRLTITGGSSMTDYETRLRTRVQALGLGKNVEFTGPVSREKLPAIYQQHDLCIFPSVWNEPFSITLLEALSSGLAVVGTNTGGSAEILRHETNAMVFEKDDARACAQHLHRLLEQPQLFEEIRLNGRRTVEQHFRIEQMIETIEEALHEAVAKQTSHQSSHGRRKSQAGAGACHQRSP